MGWRGPMTHRCWLGWLAWQESEWERPNRTDHYLMQLTAGVERLIALQAGQRVKVMNAEDIKGSNMRLAFAPAPDPATLAADEEALREHEMTLSKQLALLRVGNRPVVELPMTPAMLSGEVEEQPDFSVPRIDPALAARINADAAREED